MSPPFYSEMLFPYHRSHDVKHNPKTWKIMLCKEPVSASTKADQKLETLLQLALAGCKFSWATQVFQCSSALGEPLLLESDAPMLPPPPSSSSMAIDIKLLQELFLRDRLASFDSLPQDPRLAPSAGVKLCTCHRWFGRPQNAACPSYWESPMGNCTGFSGFAWGLITSQLKRAAISTCLGPVMSATCAILEQ